jgi:ABC-type antimicrobial peptide transport system permease subunit
MTGMKSYYVSRVLFAAALGAVLVLGGSAWWIGAIAGTLALVWFLVAPHIGRHPEHGVTALRRDERGAAINNSAARNAFVASMLAVAGMIVYAGAFSVDRIPVAVLQGLLLLGVVVYYLSDFWLRRINA